MSDVAVVGAGAIGSAVALRLLAAGHQVVVWNRTPGRSAELLHAGAVPALTVQEAVSSSRLILLTVKDYTAMRSCLEQIEGPLPGRTIVAMCTGSAADARLAAEQVARSGAEYLDAGIQASAESIGTAAATILYSGSRGAFDRHSATLELLSTPRFVGSSPDSAAVWDLALFGLWYDAQLGLLRALDTVRGAGVDVAEFAEAASTQLGHVLAAVSATVGEAQDAVYPPGPADLTEHLAVVRHLMDLRADQRLGDGGLREVATRIEALIAAGHGSQGLTATIS
ncbi:NAD(P)-dependent oxidoreductase [Asanoa iriomotensis]|uniref:6-phosphogluconate dehydrogenase n=1 Tax=Asanoa iriomotensis TaxID=234613 RepID=A0ABQ4CFB1_9ACTN|nr:FAD-dependent oxidoreductase [Asanoa iriomotensis]GIF61445.1 6-phosphogluconate dehydrogenase [Asanoa iriomotensis]